jgi:hypothetical protein
VKYEGADREADPIESALLTTKPAVVARGKRFLDDPAQGGYYTVYRRRLQVPHKGAGILPGAVIRVQSARYGIDAVGRVASYAIQGDMESIWATIEFEEFVE